MDKKLMAGPPKGFKPKRPSTVSSVTATTSRQVPSKDRTVRRVNKNATIISNADVTVCKNDSIPSFDAEYRNIAYGKFLREMLEEILVDEKIAREETQMDIQMAQLADRFSETMDQLDKTNRRLKDISFVVEQKRLLDLKNQDCTSFYDITDQSDVQTSLNNLLITEKSKLDRLDTKNVDFGYTKETGHKQLLDAVNDAIDGLELIKKKSDLSIDKLKEYADIQKNVEAIELDRLDFDTLKTDIVTKLPKLCEKTLIDASESLAEVIQDDKN